MDKQLFDDIVASLNEAIAITKGEVAPSRVFSHERPDVKAIRNKTGLSQVQFAQKLNISPKTVQNWEQGTRRPTGPAITLMQLIDKNPNLLSMA